MSNLLSITRFAAAAAFFAIPISVHANPSVSGNAAGTWERHGQLSLQFDAAANSIGELQLGDDGNEDYQCSPWKVDSVRVESSTVSPRGILSLVVKHPRAGKDIFDEIDLSALPRSRRVLLPTLLAPGRQVQISSRGCGSGLVPYLRSISVPGSTSSRLANNTITRLVTAEVIRPANVRTAPTTQGSRVLSTIHVAILSGLCGW